MKKEKRQKKTKLLCGVMTHDVTLMICRFPASSGILGAAHGLSPSKK